MILTVVTDASYIGEIVVLITVPTNWQLKAIDKFTQLLLLPSLHEENVFHEGAFSSTNKTVSLRPLINENNK